ncbi:MAG TPA: TdeIII family type II restriction endonuclease [Anaerolineales bacterium]|nr:TdeIII family type II restriction endonuclease [Anaerolineales bacterium]
MSPIAPETKAEIKGYLEGFIRGLIEQHRAAKRRSSLRQAKQSGHSPGGELKPFHEAILPAELLRASTFERSFSTRLGNTFEECARLIARQRFPVVERGYRTMGKVSFAADAKIEEIINRLQRARHHTPLNFLEWVEEVLRAESEAVVQRRIVADLYLRDEKGFEYFFELKSPRPNKGQCLEVTQRLLRAHALRRAPRPQVQAFYAMAYNPYGEDREDYAHSIALNYLDMEHEALLGREFWEFLGGEGTYEELLNIYCEVGNEHGKALLDALLFDW